MCEHCKHGQELLCTCGPVQGGDSFRMAVHLSENMTDVDWRLTYNSLMDINPYQLCMVGKCRICGGRLCIEQKPFGIITTDDFLAAAYRHLYQFHHNLAQPLSHKEFRIKFVQMFREEDRPVVQEWLARPENSHVVRMYRRSNVSSAAEEGQKKIMVYTIIRTGIDTDRGSFPNPQTEGSFLSPRRARVELQKLIRAEKEELDDRYDSQEYGENYWEACQSGYAAALFTRLEIVSSELKFSQEWETLEDLFPCKLPRRMFRVLGRVRFSFLQR